MRSETSVDIAAAPGVVFRLARDPLRWPVLLPHYVRARQLARDGSRVQAEYVALRSIVPVLGLGLPILWRSWSWSDESDRTIRFHHVGGASRGMDVTWRIEPTPDGCRATIEHDFRPRIDAWALFLERFFVRPIARRTLATFKGIAEALDDAGTVPAESAPRRRTKTPA